MGIWTRRDRPSRRPSCSNGGWRPSRVRKSASRLGAARAGMRSPTGRDPLAALPATGERATKAGRVVGVDSRTPEAFRFSHTPGVLGYKLGYGIPKTQQNYAFAPQSAPPSKQKLRVRFSPPAPGVRAGPIVMRRSHTLSVPSRMWLTTTWPARLRRGACHMGARSPFDSI